MNFQTVTTEIIDESTDVTPERKAQFHAHVNEHPRLWHIAQHYVAHKYERQTGNKIGANFDWSTIKDWLIKNLPAILMALLTLFGA